MVAETEHPDTFQGHMEVTSMAGCMGHLMKDAIRIQLHPNTFRRNTEFPLSHPSYLVIDMLKWGRHQNYIQKDQGLGK
jgi:hypothetical protein